MRRMLGVALVTAVLVGGGCGRSGEEEGPGSGRAGKRVDQERSSPAEPAGPWRVLGSAELQGELFLNFWDLDPNGTFYAVLHRRPGEDGDARFLVAADTTQGRELWHLGLASDLWPVRVLRVPDGPLLAYHPGHAMLALDPATGKRLWRKPTPEPNWQPGTDTKMCGAGALALASNGVLMLTPTELALMDPADWSRQWSVPLDARGLSLRYAPPVIVDSTIVFIVDDQTGRRRRLVAVDENHPGIVWQADVGEIVSRGTTFDSEQGGGAVGDGAVVCLADLIWTEGVWGVVATPEELDALEARIPKPRLLCFDLATGEKRWERRLTAWPSEYHNSPVVCDGFALVFVKGHFVTETDHHCLVHDLRDGAVAGEVPEVDTPPVGLGKAVAWFEHPSRVAIAEPPTFEVVERVDLAQAKAGRWFPWFYGVRALWGRVVVVDYEDQNGGRSVTYVAVVGREPE